MANRVLAVCTEKSSKVIGTKEDVLHSISASPPTQLHTLRRVVALAESHAFGDKIVTLLSLEDYEDGFIFRWRLSPAPERSHPLVTELLFSAEDHHGTQYRSVPYGGGVGQGTHMNAWTTLIPAIISEAAHLTVRIALARWELLGADSTRAALRELAAVPPWSFAVELSAGKTWKTS